MDHCLEVFFSCNTYRQLEDVEILLQTAQIFGVPSRHKKPLPRIKTGLHATPVSNHDPDDNIPSKFLSPMILRPT